MWSVPVANRSPLLGSHGTLPWRTMAEITSPETDKFTAPLVLVHGLWAGAADWRRFAGYLAHRGWRCIAWERPPGLESVAAMEADLRREIAAHDGPPVIVGHDLGANLALRCADGARAVVALAPLVGSPGTASPRVLERAGTWWERLTGAAHRHPPGGTLRGAYPYRHRWEPTSLLRTIAAGKPLASAAPAVPRLILAMDGDEITAPDAAGALARQHGAALQVIADSGHAVLLNDAWAPCVAAVHRWLIRELGVELLALYDEAWEGREP